MDYSLLPQDQEAPYGQGLRLKRAVAATRSPGGVLTNNVQVGEASGPAYYRDRAANLYREGSDLMNAEPDMSTLQAYARQRGQEGESAMLNALAAQFAGERFEPVQAQFLKRASAARDPMKLAGGMVTADGQFIKDPIAQRDKRAEFLLNQAKAYEQMAATAETAQQRAEAKAAQDAISNQLRLLGINAARASSGGTFSLSGFDPEGNQVVTNSKTGMSYQLGMTPDGQPTYTPYVGVSTPKGTFDKNVGVVQQALSSAGRADRLLEMVDQNPDAFSLKASAVSALPEFVQGRVGAMVMDENTMQMRSNILRQAAMEISDLYGAALSMGEQARANTFIPNANDGPEAIIAKLRAARDWAKSTAESYGPAAINAARGRGSNPPPVPGGGGALSAEEQAELERLRAKFRGQR